MDLEVRDGQRESMRSNVRTMGQPRIFLLGLGPKPQPTQLAAKLIAEVVVTSGPRASVKGAGVSMVSFWIMNW